MYRFTWFVTPSDVSREVNDGRWPPDFKVSRGLTIRRSLKFKLGRNTQRKRKGFEQLRSLLATASSRLHSNDLNQPGIKWRIPYGDDPELAARGITGTSVPGIQNSIIVTESGLVFGAGRDNFIRAWDSDTGKQLWVSRFGGNFTGSPAMYEMGSFLPQPRGGRWCRRGAAARCSKLRAAPLGWVVYTLPAK